VTKGLPSRAPASEPARGHLEARSTSETANPRRRPGRRYGPNRLGPTATDPLGQDRDRPGLNPGRPPPPNRGLRWHSHPRARLGPFDSSRPSNRPARHGRPHGLGRIGASHRRMDQPTAHIGPERSSRTLSAAVDRRRSPGMVATPVANVADAPENSVTISEAARRLAISPYWCRGWALAARGHREPVTNASPSRSSVAPAHLLGVRCLEAFRPRRGGSHEGGWAVSGWGSMKSIRMRAM
jgi:hypothetical protein